jgi:hypothetical protein
MAKDVRRVLVGVGGLYAAPVGTAAPNHFTAPAAPWEHVGYTTGGVTMESEDEEQRIEVDQSLEPILVIATGRNTTISTNLAQFGPEQLKLAFGGGTITLVDPDGTANSGDEYDVYEPPAVGAGDEVALLFDGINEDQRPVRLYVPRAKVAGRRQITFRKDEPATLAATWQVLTPATGSPFAYRLKRPA